MAVNAQSISAVRAHYVEEVRQALAALQGPRAQCRLLTGVQRQIRAALRVEKLHLGALLRPFGLRLKGFEVRGWRSISTPPPVAAPPTAILLALHARSVRARRPTETPATRLARFLSIRDGSPSPAG